VVLQRLELSDACTYFLFDAGVGVYVCASDDEMAYGEEGGGVQMSLIAYPPSMQHKRACCESLAQCCHACHANWRVRGAFKKRIQGFLNACPLFVSPLVCSLPWLFLHPYLLQ
jgi:hypothetical protein